MKTNRFKKVSIMAVGFLLAASFASADEAGRFVSVEGRVDVLKAGADEPAAAKADDIVSAGDIVRTKGRSKTEINFADNSSLKIGENSRVQIKEYNIENGERTSGAILVERGGVRAIVSKTSGKNDFIIDTPNATGSVKGTDLFVTFQKSATSVLVINGKFSVANLAFPDKVVDITSGNATLIPADEPPQAPREYLALEKSNYEIFTEPAKEATAEGYTEPGEIKAKITAVSGRVQIRSRGSITWHDAKVNELLSAGDTIETKDNGKIEIRLENGNVIDLKPDSQLVLQKLTQDTKSGDYQNLFESSRGRLRAKVSKLKGDSKFEIKTPTAVTGVRGTIMFLSILPNLTNSYFEDGDGYIQSAISGVSKIVPAGNASSADANGNITDPQPPSDAERSGWQEGWDTGGDTGDNGSVSTPSTGEDFNPPIPDMRVIEPPLPPVGPAGGSVSISGKFSGSIRGAISGTVSGVSSHLSGQNSGRWGSDSSGTYSSVPTVPWSAVMVGSGDIASGPLSWASTMSGTAWGGGTLSATINGVALYETGLGAVSGNSTGVYDTGTWSTHDIGTYKEIINLTTQSLAHSKATGNGYMAGNGWGDIDGGLMAGLAGVAGVTSPGGTPTPGGCTYDSGTISGILAGTGNAASAGHWRLALGMTDIYPDSGSGGGFGLVTADSSTGAQGVGFGAGTNMFILNSFDGGISGITNVDTTWNANVSGTWVDLAELAYDSSGVGFNNVELYNFVSVPITETYSSLLTGSGSLAPSGTINVTQMNMNFYAHAAADLSGIWTALLNGSYTNPGGGYTTGSVALSGAGTTASLYNLQWNYHNDNRWTAQVSGTAPGPMSFTGAAGGTFTGTTSGTLTGVGAGKWTKP